jgi:Clp amino terminal domain, pathogenicity island component
MTTRRKQAAIALTGAVALASGAYALGSQAGGGTAGAAGTPDDPKPPALVRSGAPQFAFGLDRLADRLGVDESDLRDALEDVRPDPPDPGDIRDDFAKALADELGIEQSRVEEALERVREKAADTFEQRHEDFVQRLADRLNLDPDKVEDALDDGPVWGLRRPAHP